MITVNTNMSSIIAQNSLYKSTNKMNTALQRLSTGLRISRAKDDAAGSAISTKLEYKISSYDVAKDNAQMGQSMLDTANGTLSSINSMLQRMRDLSEQAANGTYGKEEREAMQAEVDALSAEIKRIKNTTEFNGKKLFETENEIETATQINTNANKPVTLSAISNNGIATYASNDNVIDMSAISDDDWDSTAGKVIKLNTADDLKKLATITNGGKDTSGRTFALGADIDMQGVSDFVPIGGYNRISFEGVFDGQGFTISNLTINSNDKFVGFFGDTNRATIKNVILDNVKIIANNSGGIYGGLIGKSGRTTVDSCFVTGSIENAGYNTGGLIGQSSSVTVTNCSTNTSVKCKCTFTQSLVRTGAFIGISTSSSISNCTASGSVIIESDANSSSHTGGFVGFNYSGIVVNCSSSADISLRGTSGDNSVLGGFAGYNRGPIENCKYTGKIDNSCSGVKYLGAFVGRNYNSDLKNNEYKYDTTFLATGAPSTTSINNYGESKGGYDGAVHNSNTTDYPPPAKPAKKDKYPAPTPTPTPTPTPSSKSTTDYCRFNLQVGINSTENSVIEIDTGFKLGDFTISLLDSEDGTIKGDKNARKAIDTIDTLMARVTNKMTDIASIQNRIESVIEFQEVQRNALTSANSLIKDADIALESANYLKNQILQNVTSALLSTANQSPQIALQLI